jgi:CheY-like chemotaxis protein
MPQGGRLVLRLARLTIESIQESPLPEVREGEWVVLTVSDNGTGIKPEILQHIFEPFFTTKVAGEGTGLGLSQVYGIIRQHNGVIDMQTDVGKGTDLIIYLPSIDKQEEEIIIEEDSELLEGHGETILVVEDNEEVRGLIETVLSRLGYTLLTASNGHEAIGIFEENSESIRLVITDVVMPEMGGVEMSVILKERKPSLPIIALSGYPIGIEEDSIKDAGIEELIHKPVHINTLAEMLYKLLNKNQ